MMSNLEFRLSDMEFMQPCQYYLSLQLDENKKRLRTKVSAETKNPVFDEAFCTTDFEEDFAIIGQEAIERTLTLDVFVVLTKQDSTSAHELLRQCDGAAASLRALRYAAIRDALLSFTRLEKKSNTQIDVGRFKLDIVEVKKPNAEAADARAKHAVGSHRTVGDQRRDAGTAGLGCCEISRARPLCYSRGRRRRN